MGIMHPPAQCQINRVNRGVDDAREQPPATTQRDGLNIPNPFVDWGGGGVH